MNDDVRGYDEQSNRRISAMVRKSERLAEPLAAPSSYDSVTNVRRVILNDSLLFDAPASGRERLQGPDGLWKTTTTVIPNIYLGTPETGLLETNDEVWIVPMHNKWFSVAAASSGRDPDPASRTCCGPCIGQTFMTVDDLYAKKYLVKSLPAALGGSEVRLHFVGTLSEYPAQLTGTIYGWESDSFEFTVDDTTDLYTWMLASMVGTSQGGADSTVLYLKSVGSATTGPNLSVPNCIDGSIADIFVQFANIADWRARCGSILMLRFPQWQQKEAETILPCSVCVSPIKTIDYEDLDSCWQGILDTLGLSELPGTLYVRMESFKSRYDDDDKRRLGQAWATVQLDFDLDDMKYHAVRWVSRPDCAGSDPRPNGFHIVGYVDDDSDIGSADPPIPDPYMYFEIGCVDDETIRVTAFTSEEWEVSPDGSTHSCSADFDLTITTALSGVFTTYIHAERVTPTIDEVGAEIEWSVTK